MPRKIDPGTLIVGPGRKSTRQEPTDSLGEASASLSEHVTTTSSAHEASSIGIDGKPPQYDSGNVEGALDELSALVPPRPATLGTYREGIGDPGITDWGILKLNDSPLDERDGATDWGIDPAEVYGYYYTPPTPKIAATAFSPLGADEATDPVFNVWDLKFPFGGEGECHAGAFTRVSGGGTNPLSQTMRIVPSSGIDGGKGVVISGVLYPADRGVLALVHWPANGDTADFLAQDLDKRCLAAVLLGQGVSTGCDGLVGGIFELGDDGSGGFDPFAFPGQASGQKDLAELHAADNSAGQVRLGTDPAAGETPITNGITIFGGQSNSRGGGSASGTLAKDSNFFAYRLPYLSDYSDGILGLPFTPASEKARYYDKTWPALDFGTDLTQAGNYTDFTKDYWTFQLARYRHYFEMDDTLLPSGSPRDNGSYLLLHFRTEAAFEALVRDGIAPADEDLYNPNLADWVDPEAPANIALNDPGNNFPEASSYHVVRSAVFEDPEGTTDPTVTVARFTLDRNGGADDDIVTWVSGVAYFSPVTANGRGPLRITNLDFAAQDFFAHTYRTKEPGVSAGDEYLANMNPAVVNLAPFSYEDGTLIVGFTPQLIARQRLEFAYSDLGAFSVTNGPLSGAAANFSSGADTIYTWGDPTVPSFSVDAKMRLFLRRPLGHGETGTTFLPYPSVPMSEVGGDTILFHTTAGALGEYGNVETAPGSGVLEPSLETALKDVEERFLDETYRYRSDWTTGTLSHQDQTRLIGPGLPSGAGIVDLPVRAGTITAPWDSVSWFIQRDFAQRLFSVPGLLEAQVAGLPERAPSLDYPVLSPFPSRGLLVYPKENYGVGFRPSFTAGDITSAQWDYGAVTGDRTWNRAFDAGFSRDATPVAADGQPFVILKIWGLGLADFGYTVPGPGTTDVAILVKVPGLTTWMDVGRADGSGPGKQDILLDGAGCQVVGPETFEDVDTDTRLVYSQVKINVGPSASLFQNSLGEVPVLVKVILKDTAGGRNLDFTQTTATGDPGLLRGVAGIEVVRPT